MMNNHCRYVCTFSEDVVTVKLPSGANVDVPSDLIKRSGTLSNAVPTTDPDSEFTLVFPTGYLEAWLQHADALSHQKSPLACSSRSQTPMRELVVGLKVRVFSISRAQCCHSLILWCVERASSCVCV